MPYRQEKHAAMGDRTSQNQTIVALHSALDPTSHLDVDEAQLLRKIDLHVVPILFLVYIVAFLDRVNISNALTLGLPAELGLVGDQPNVALTIFFVPYIIFEIPSNEAQKRFTMYWSSTIFAGAFGGLLASAIANMDGIRGLSSWRWIFILEGIATILIGLLAVFCITHFSREAKWLSPEEKSLLFQKTGVNESHAASVTSKDLLYFFSQSKNWIAAIMYFSLLVSAYSIVYFLPTIVQALGYGTIQTQLHAVLPFTAAFGFAVVLAYLSDKSRLRSPFIFLGLALLIAGLAVLISAQGAAHFSAEYAALCLVAMGSFGVGGNMVCSYVMNLRGHAERGIGLAWMICFGNVGGVVATFLFQKKDAPYYHSGYSVCLAMSALCVASCACYWFSIWWEREKLSKDDSVRGSEDQSLFL
ncbi:major facilitator superfamily transporter [Seiridium cupressi]